MVLNLDWNGFGYLVRYGLGRLSYLVLNLEWNGFGLSFTGWDGMGAENLAREISNKSLYVDGCNTLNSNSSVRFGVSSCDEVDGIGLFKFNPRPTGVFL